MKIANFWGQITSFFSVIWVKWEQSECSINLPYFSTFYSLFLPFFVLEIFKLKYDKFFVWHSASISKSKWFEQPCRYYRIAIDTLENYSNFKSNFSFNSGSILEIYDHFRTKGNASFNDLSQLINTLSNKKFFWVG